MKTVPIQLWHGDIAATEKKFLRYWPLLSADEQARAIAIKTESKSRRYVLVHGHLRNLLAGIVNEPPETLRIIKSDRGKPYLADYPEVAFNLSHSGDTMAVAIGTNCRLGVDIEMCRPRASLTAMVDKCFAEVEAAWWRALPEAEKNFEFYRFWTRKEAFVKATGHGISLGLSHCVVNPEKPATWLSVPESCGQAAKWHVRDIDLGLEVCCALAADKTISDIEPLSI